MNLSYGNPGGTSLLEYSRSIDCFCAYSAGPTAYAYTATALGPILYNGTASPPPYPERKAIVMGVSIAVTAAATGAIAVGLAWGKGSITNTTAVTLASATYPTNKQASMTAYNTGTVSAAAYGFLPLLGVPTTALTALNAQDVWIALDGMIVLPAGTWVALATSATDATAAFQYAIVWGETTK